VSGASKAAEAKREAKHAAAAPPVVRLNDPDKLQVSIQRFGNDANPVLVVDDALANAEEIRGYALGLQWLRAVQARSYYPGYTAMCGLRGIDAVGAWAARRLWKEAYGLDDADPASRLGEVQTDAFFAIFAPERDCPYSVVHVDSHSWLAMLVYLTPGEENASATGFWRHVPTGLESGCTGRIDVFSTMHRFDAVLKTKLLETPRAVLAHAPNHTYADWLAELIKTSSKTPPFPSGDYGPWQKIGAVSARFNRLVAYPTWQFHSILPTRPELATTLASARLTLNGFIKHPAFESIEPQEVALLEGLG
jgi:hypothetical protein